MVFDKFEMTIDLKPFERELSEPMRKNRETYADKVLDEVEDVFTRLVRFYAPKDTGDYAASWDTVARDENSVTIGTNRTMLFSVLEFGVDHPWTIEAEDAESLSWVDSSGTRRFAKSVTHPPQKAQPHLRKAFADFEKIYRHIMLAVLGELVPAFRKSTRDDRRKVDDLLAKTKQ